MVSRGIGLESLLQRGKSAFYNDLVALYQKTQDALRGAYTASQTDIALTLKKMNFQSQLKDIVHSNMGVLLSRVDIAESHEPNLMCTLLTTKQFKQARKGNAKTAGMILETVHQLYDDRTGRLTAKDLTHSPFAFTITIFTSLWSIRNTDHSFYLTPEELAAGTLHECGHIDHYIRALLRTYNTTLDASDIVDYLQETPDRDVIMSLIAALKKSPCLQKDWQKVIASAESYFTKSNSLNDGAAYEALSALSAVVTSECASRNLLDYNGLVGNAFARVPTRLLDIDAERSADEFASRNGAYAALTSLLSKMDALGSTKANLYLRQFLWDSPAAIFGLLISFTTLFSISSENISNGYDPMLRRLELIVETAKHAFQDATLNEEAKADIRSQINDAEYYLKEYRSAGHRRIRVAMKTWLDNISRFGRIFISPIQNRLHQDYERLQNANRSLSRNSLYYLAQK